MIARLSLGVMACVGVIFVSACSSGDGSSGDGGSAGSTSQGGTGGTGNSADPFDANRVACVKKINDYRATKGLPALARWTEAELCVDQQASEDSMTMTAHGAWIGGKYTCNGAGQNECPGWGADGIEACLDSMWGEGSQTACAGCDACNDGYNPDCPNCDFYGQQSGMTCGHYANMIAKYVTKVACGFSAQGGWDAINFE